MDDLGNTVYDGNYSTDKEASGEVISNSNVLLWKPSCTIEDAYSGGFTAYARRQDGVESEGFPVSCLLYTSEMYKAQLKLADDRVTRFMWAAPGL